MVVDSLSMSCSIIILLQRRPNSQLSPFLRPRCKPPQLLLLSLNNLLSLSNNRLSQLLLSLRLKTIMLLNLLQLQAVPRRPQLLQAHLPLLPKSQPFLSQMP